MMSLRSFGRLALNEARSWSKQNVCQMSTAVPLVDVKVNDTTGVATVTMQRAPVNGLNLDLLQAISKTLDDLTENRAKGMILTSSLPTIFSGGLDIMEMYKPDPQRVREFWSTLQEVWMKLYGTPYPTAAAINGHSPAGGCLMAMSCEYRVMVGGKFTIGLNETALGIVAPSWFQDTLKNTISPRVAEMALTLGTLFPVDEALKIGMIDETATDKEDAIAKCEKFILRFDKINRQARALTKFVYRGQTIQRLQENQEQDLELFCSTVTDPKVQKSLDKYIQALKGKKQ